MELDKKFIVTLQGKDFVTYAGLIAVFHDAEGTGVEVSETSTSTADHPKFRAVVRGKRGEYVGHGDATAANVNAMIRPHIYRMAETRAIARALRLYCNIGMTALEELGGEVVDTQTKNPVDAMLQKVIDGVAAIDSLEELEAYWDKHSYAHKKRDFIDAVNNRKAELQEQALDDSVPSV